MYIIKTQGNKMIPDCIQIRNNNFVLIAYIRVDRPFKDIISKLRLNYSESGFLQMVNALPIGKIQKIQTNYKG